MNDAPFTFDDEEVEVGIIAAQKGMITDATKPGPKIYRDLEQGSEAWLDCRRGLITASEMKLLLTPATLKIASNDKERAHMWELAAQRITKYTEPQYVGDAMLRGHDDEIIARQLYAENFAEVEEVGFITNDRHGFTIGYSPDALVGDKGLLECKSRKQRFQIETIATQLVPDEFALQLQTGLLVSEREWIDFISFSGGLPMCVIRVYPDRKVQDAILSAVETFEARIAKTIADYDAAIRAMPKVVETERRIVEEMFL